MNHDLRLARLAAIASLIAVLSGAAAYAEPTQSNTLPAVCGQTASYSGDCEYY